MPGEFELIANYFNRPVRKARLGVGDDCALIALDTDMELAISTDMLVEGTHFLAGTDARRLGHKTLAVNLSDLAAMGAQPHYATLAMSLPHAEAVWLGDFSAGFLDLASAHGVELIGGDTTRGPLNLCVTVFGEVLAGGAIRRSGARADDDIWVSGTLGDAALGLACLKGAVTLATEEAAYAVARLESPTPRVALGLALRGVASAMLDVSDGLIGDLRHLAQAAALDATVEAEALPLAEQLARPWARMPLAERLGFVAGSGDDYELCFTAAPSLRDQVRAAGARGAVRLTKIGRMSSRRGASGAVFMRDADGNPCLPTVSGHEHFWEPA